MDFSRLSRWEVVGAVGAALGAITLFLLPWYSIEITPEQTDQGAWLCGVGDDSCTGWETFPIMRWLLLAAGTAPIILAWIVVRGHKLSYPPGEITMVVGLTGFVLIGYNGVIDKPGSGVTQDFVSLDFGYWVALLVGVLITAAGFMRAEESQTRQRKAPGTV